MEYLTNMHQFHVVTALWSAVTTWKGYGGYVMYANLLGARFVTEQCNVSGAFST